MHALPELPISPAIPRAGPGGRDDNRAGYLWSSAPLVAADTADDKLALPELVSGHGEPEPFAVVEHVDDRWLFVAWSWD